MELNDTKDTIYNGPVSFLQINDCARLKRTKLSRQTRFHNASIDSVILVDYWYPYNLNSFVMLKNMKHDIFTSEVTAPRL